jgi:hypothetical protein
MPDVTGSASDFLLKQWFTELRFISEIVIYYSDSVYLMFFKSSLALFASNRELDETN